MGDVVADARALLDRWSLETWGARREAGKGLDIRAAEAVGPLQVVCAHEVRAPLGRDAVPPRAAAAGGPARAGRAPARLRPVGGAQRRAEGRPRLQGGHGSAASVRGRRLPRVQRRWPDAWVFGDPPKVWPEDVLRGAGWWAKRLAPWAIAALLVVAAAIVAGLAARG